MSDRCSDGEFELEERHFSGRVFNTRQQEYLSTISLAIQWHIWEVAAVYPGKKSLIITLKFHMHTVKLSFIRFSKGLKKNLYIHVGLFGHFEFSFQTTEKTISYLGTLGFIVTCVNFFKCASLSVNWDWWLFIYHACRIFLFVHIWVFLFQDMSCSKEPLSVPVERYITHLLEEVPFPEPRILIQVILKFYFNCEYHTGLVSRLLPSP